MKGGLYPDVKAIATRGKPPGCTFTLLLDEKSARTHLFSLRLATEVTGGVYPWLWVQLRFDPGSVEREAVDAVLGRWNLTVFQEGRLNLPFAI
jgi:hypothetical protein